MPLGRVLIADDQVNILDALKLLLGSEGFDVATATSPNELVAELERSDFDVALIDLNYTRDTTSGHEGFALLDRIKAIDPTLPVLVMTGWSSVAGAVEAMRRGARDYIEKPWDDDKLVAARADAARTATGAAPQPPAAGEKCRACSDATCRRSSPRRRRCARCARRSSAWRRPTPVC
jgi:DNA-binding NtrC family response regulator